MLVTISLVGSNRIPSQKLKKVSGLHNGRSGEVKTLGVAGARPGAVTAGSVSSASLSTPSSDMVQTVTLVKRTFFSSVLTPYMG